MKFETAEVVAAKTLEACEAVHQMLWTIKNEASEEEFLRYRKVVAYVIGTLDMDILVKIYAEHPELEKRDRGLHPEEADPSSAQ